MERGHYKNFQQKSAFQHKNSHVPGFCPIIRHGERSDNVDFEAMGIEIEEM
jgi:hypothetical protein